MPKLVRLVAAVLAALFSCQALAQEKLVVGTEGAYPPFNNLTAEGELAPIEDLPNFGTADISGDWIAWVTADQVTGDVREYDEIRVRRLDGAGEAVLSPPDGWRFSNTPFTFEDNQFFVARVVDGRQQRMARCSPALVECVLLDTPSADQ